MKVIFLDVDGVLNYRDCFLERHRVNNAPLIWDKDCVNELNRIIKETGAKIVVSSTWRILDDHYKALTTEMGIEGEFIGKTKSHLPITKPEGTCRGDEIQDWITTFCIETNNAPGNIVILDDDSDMGDLLPYLVQTSFHKKGLTKELADEAIVMLNKGY